MKTKPKNSNATKKALVLREPIVVNGRRRTELHDGEATFRVGVEVVRMQVADAAPVSPIMLPDAPPPKMRVQLVPVPRWEVTVVEELADGRTKGVALFLPHSSAYVRVPVEVIDGEVMGAEKADAVREQKTRMREERCGTETGVESSDALAEVES